MAETKPREKQIDAWYRDLQGGRIEVMCKAPGYRLRVTAMAERAWEAVELFEGWTGLTVQFDKRPPRRRGAPQPIAGQLTIMHELESDGKEE